MLFLADIGNHELEDIVICLVIAGVVAFVIYLVLVHGFKQPWGAMAAAVVFLVGALLCLL